MNCHPELVSLHVWAAMTLLEDAVRARRGETYAERMRRYAVEDAQYGHPAPPEEAPR